MAYRYIQYDEKIVAVSFKYPSKHNEYELEAAKNITDYFDVPHEIVDLSSLFDEKGWYRFRSSLLQTQGDIPEGHYNDETMKQTVIPGRNTIFIAVLLGIAQSEEADQIAIAAHTGDHHIYPDCRLGYLQAMARAVNLASEEKVHLLYPFITKTKADIIRLGYSLMDGFPYELTRTCYKDQEIACGKCGSCNERLEAFAEIGRKDPITYE
jgi:7-cyano-7-deazaguanine synthase